MWISVPSVLQVFFCCRKYDIRKLEVQYFEFGYIIFPVNALKKRTMRRRMRESRGLKVICYAACLIDLNNYLAVLPWAKESEKCM